ncbi:MAG: hypothetical protein WDZ59_04750 [Pirellulales bacterium]
MVTADYQYERSHPEANPFAAPTEQVERDRSRLRTIARGVVLLSAVGAAAWTAAMWGLAAAVLFQSGSANPEARVADAALLLLVSMPGPVVLYQAARWCHRRWRTHT